MIVQKRSLNWLPRPSLYDQQASARARMQATHNQFLGRQTDFFDKISAIQADALVQTGQLISKIAVSRITSKLA
jgi:hypothetical protein